jgi:hypothetical protein
LLGFQSVGSQTGFQRWFLNNEYQKFSYFKNCIFFQMKIKSILQKTYISVVHRIQKNLQILLTFSQNLNHFQLTTPN